MQTIQPLPKPKPNHEWVYIQTPGYYQIPKKTVTKRKPTQKKRSTRKKAIEGNLFKVNLDRWIVLVLAATAMFIAMAVVFG